MSTNTGPRDMGENTPVTTGNKCAYTYFVAPSVALGLIFLLFITYAVPKVTSLHVINSFEIVMTLASLCILGYFIRDYAKPGDRESYEQIEDDCNDKVGRHSKKKVSVLVVLALGYSIFGINQCVTSGRCMAEQKQYISSFILEIAELLFVAMQTAVMILLMLRRASVCIFKLERFLPTVLVTDFVFVLRFGIRIYSDYKAKHFSQFPHLMICMTNNASDVCDAYSNPSTPSLYINAYLYSFEVLYMLFSFVTLLHYIRPTKQSDLGKGCPEEPSNISSQNRIAEMWRYLEWAMYHASKTPVCVVLSSLVCCVLLGIHFYVNKGTYQRVLADCNANQSSYIMDNSDFEPKYAEFFVGALTIFNYFPYTLLLLTIIFIAKHNTLSIKIDYNCLLLLFVACSQFAINIVETVEAVLGRGTQSDHRITSFLWIFIVCNYYGILCQVFFLLVCLQQRQEVSGNYRKIFFKVSIIFTGICSIEKLFSGLLFPPVILVFLSKAKLTIFEIETWWVIVKAIYPFLCFYRLLSAMICYRYYAIHYRGIDPTLNRPLLEPSTPNQEPRTYDSTERDVR